MIPKYWYADSSCLDLLDHLDRPDSLGLYLNLKRQTGYPFDDRMLDMVDPDHPYHLYPLYPLCSLCLLCPLYLPYHLEHLDSLGRPCPPFDPVGLAA